MFWKNQQKLPSAPTASFCNAPFFQKNHLAKNFQLLILIEIAEIITIFKLPHLMNFLD